MAPLEEAEAEFDNAPPDEEDAGADAELEGAPLEELMVTVELWVRVMVLKTVRVDVGEFGEPLLEPPWLDWLPDEPLPLAFGGVFVETEVRVSGQMVVDIGMADVTVTVPDGQSETEAGQL